MKKGCGAHRIPERTKLGCAASKRPETTRSDTTSEISVAVEEYQEENNFGETTADEKFKYQPLFDAVQRDDWNFAQEFLSRNPDAAKSSHPTVATIAGNLEIMKEAADKMNKALVDEELKYQPLFDAVQRDDWNSAQVFLRRNPEAVKSRHRTTGQTALYVATLAGNLEIVEKLLDKMEKQDLEIPDYDGDTALIAASLTGTVGLAECIVKKNPKLVSIGGRRRMKQIPVVVAASFGHVHMAEYLYSVTPPEDVQKDKNDECLLRYSIQNHDYDIAWDLLCNCPRLAITSFAIISIKTLAAQPGLFLSTCGLNFWQQWIYARIDMRENQASNDTCINVPTQKESQTNRKNISCQGVLKQLTSIARKLLGIERIYKLKLSHVHWRQVLQKTFEKIKNTKIKELE